MIDLKTKSFKETNLDSDVQGSEELNQRRHTFLATFLLREYDKIDGTDTRNTKKQLQ